MGLTFLFCRTTRESTPCSLIRDSDAIRTSGSSDRPTTGDDANSRMQNPMLRDIPTANEINEFFSRAENQLHKQFVEKYEYLSLRKIFSDVAELVKNVRFF